MPIIGEDETGGHPRRLLHPCRPPVSSSPTNRGPGTVSLVGSKGKALAGSGAEPRRFHRSGPSHRSSLPRLDPRTAGVVAFDEVQGAAFGFVEDAAQVFADDAEGQDEGKDRFHGWAFVDRAMAPQLGSKG